MFITVFTRARNRSLSWATRIQSIPFYPISLLETLIRDELNIRFHSEIKFNRVLKVGLHCGAGLGQGKDTFWQEHSHCQVRSLTRVQCSMYQDVGQFQMWKCLFSQHFVKKFIKQDGIKYANMGIDLCQLFYVGMTHRPDNGGSKHLWNVGQLLLDYTVQHPRRQSSSEERPNLYRSLLLRWAGSD
jgi:hypothetical protein